MKNFRIKYGVFFLTMLIYVVVFLVMPVGSGDRLWKWLVSYVIIMGLILVWFYEKGNLEKHDISKYRLLWSDKIGSFMAYKEGVLLGKNFVSWEDIKSIRLIKSRPSMSVFYRIARAMSKGGKSAHTLIIQTKDAEFNADVTDTTVLKGVLHNKHINLDLYNI